MHHFTRYLNPKSTLRGAISLLLLCLLGAPFNTSADQTSATRNELDAALANIANLRLTLSETTQSKRQRRTVIAELLQAKRKLSADFPTDDRLPLWQGDLAFDLLFLAATENGLDLTIEFGLPSPSDWAHFKALANEANALIDAATAGIADLILDLEDAPDFQSSVKLQQQRRRLVNDEARKRLPYLSATAQYYQALTADPRPVMQLAGAFAPTPAALTTAADLRSKNLQEVGLLADDLELVLDEPYRTRLRVFAGAAAYQRGESALGARQFARAESNINLQPTARMRILLTRRRADNQASTEKNPAWLNPHPFYLLLSCDFEFRQRLAADDLISPLRHRLDQLLGSYTPFLTSTDLTISKGVRERAVGEQISHALPATLPADDLPAIVLLAQAARQLADPPARAAAVTALQSLLARPEFDEWVEPRARYLLATALLLDDQKIASARAFYELARNFPQQDDGTLGLQQSLIILTKIIREFTKRANPAPPNATENRQADELFERASSLALREMPQIPDFEQWMYLRGRFELQHSKFTQAIEALTLVTTASNWYLQANVKIAESHYHAALSTMQQASPANPASWHQAIAAGEKAHALLQTALADKTNPQTRAELRSSIHAILSLIAESHLRNQNPAQALATIEGLDLQASLSGNHAATIANLLRIRVDALIALGQNEAAEAELHALANDAPARALPILTRMVGGLYTELLQLELAGNQTAALKTSAANRLLPLSDLAWTVLHRLEQSDGTKNTAADSARKNVLQFHSGEAHRLAGQFEEARRILAELKRRQPNSADVLTAYAECCYQLHDHAEALRSFSRVSLSLINDRSWRFWLAEWRSLQILDCTGKHTEKIFPRVQRLRHYDPLLGGGRFQVELIKLETRHAP